MYTFAHIADCHLGANREPVLRNLELSAFKNTLDKCMEEKVDFIIISGDLFHVNIPDMEVTNEAVKKMREVRDKGIPIYVIYGSHDYSPNKTSMIDLLDSAGLIQKIVKGSVEEGKLKLEFFVDPGTGAKLCGISARKAALEKNYFDILDRETLENEKGFKIFAFHSAITELRPEYLAGMESIPISSFPQNFDYYAGGHIHQRIVNSQPGYEIISYPGPLFAGYSRDFELSARGEKRGFFIISFGEKVEKIKFIDISICDCIYFEYDASNKNSIEAQEALLEELEKLEVENKLAIIKLKGELSGGKTSDINSIQIKNRLMEKGAIHVRLNRFGLSSKEYTDIKAAGEDSPSIENKLFTDNIGTIKISNDALKGEAGIRLARELLKVVRQEQKLNESKRDYEERLQREAFSVLHIEEAFK